MLSPTSVVQQAGREATDTGCLFVYETNFPNVNAVQTRYYKRRVEQKRNKESGWISGDATYLLRTDNVSEGVKVFKFLLESVCVWQYAGQGARVGERSPN